MAITVRGVTSTPADNGTNTTNPIVVTPVASMSTGDLVLLVGATRDAGVATFAISATGGQSWSSITTTTGYIDGFYCRYNGTWSTSPSISITSGNGAWSAVMIVAIPTTGTNVWGIDKPLVFTDVATSTVTLTGQTTTQASTITFAAWYSQDDNTWGTLTGTGWVVTGDAQYRNTSGSDISLSFAHKIQTSAGATGNVSKTQLTLGPDNTRAFIITFYESAAGAAPVVSYLTLLGAG